LKPLNLAAQDLSANRDGYCPNPRLCHDHQSLLDEGCYDFFLKSISVTVSPQRVEFRTTTDSNHAESVWGERGGHGSLGWGGCKQ